MFSHLTSNAIPHGNKPNQVTGDNLVQPLLHCKAVPHLFPAVAFSVAVAHYGHSALHSETSVVFNLHPIAIANLFACCVQWTNPVQAASGRDWQHAEKQSEV